MTSRGNAAGMLDGCAWDEYPGVTEINRAYLETQQSQHE